MSEHSSSLRPLPAARKRILLVDDHPVMIEGMSALVSGTPDLEWMGACPSLPAALEILKANLPDLILMDITLDGPNGLVATREISARYPSLPILIFTCNDENIYTPLAMAAGAKGLVTKDCAGPEILQAIRIVLQGLVYQSPRLTRVNAALPGRANPAAPSPALTSTEWSVVHYLAQGFTTLRMALAMKVSQKTIETHRLNIRRKLGLHSQSDLLRWAVCHQTNNMPGSPSPDRPSGK